MIENTTTDYWIESYKVVGRKTEVTFWRVFYEDGRSVVKGLTSHIAAQRIATALHNEVQWHKENKQ